MLAIYNKGKMKTDVPLENLTLAIYAGTSRDARKTSDRFPPSK